MSEIKDGGAAFPVPYHPEQQWENPQGMTLRDWLAGQAVGGVLHMIATGQHELGIVRPTGAAGIAHTAYEIADAMLAHRAKS